MEYNQGNFDKHTTKNPLKRMLVNKLNSRLCDKISDLKTPERNIKVLDAGCGEGFVSQAILEFVPDADILGIDFQDTAIEIAKERVKGVKFRQANIYQMPFEDKSFDVVLCSEVLEHLKYPENAISELIRVSKQYIIITVPAEPWFCLGNLLVLKNIRRLGNPIDHINHWTYKGFKKFLRNSFAVNNGSFYDCQISFSKSFPWSIAVYDKDCTEEEKEAEETDVAK